MKGRFNLILRLLIACGLIFVLFKVVPYQDLLSQLKRVDRKLVFLSFLVFLSMHLIGVVRWKLCLSALGLKVKFKDLFFLLFCGLFLNLIFPSVIAQDVFRGGLLGFKEKGSIRKVTASLVIDRFSGFLALGFIACVAYLLNRDLIQEPSVGAAIYLLSGLLLVVALFIFSRRFFGIILFFSRRLPRFKGRVRQFGEHLRVFRKDFVSFLKIFGLSFIIQMASPFCVYLIVRSFGICLPLKVFFVLVPIAIAVSLVPVTIAGLGTREAIMVYLFSRVGLEESVALGSSLIFFLFILLVGILGGIFYVTFYHRRIQSFK